MDINSAVAQFNHLVNQFNNHKDFSTEGNSIFKIKQKQLIQFSKNVNSLPVCLIVLENSNQISPLYFASQFVKDKLKYQFQQLSTTVIEDTHARIVNLIRSNRNWSKIIRNNFALCLTYLYIHCYDKLGSVLNFYCKTFQIGEILSANLGKVQYQYLFRYLDGLACQVDNKRLVIDQIKRNQVENNLKSQQKQIIMFLHHIYSHISGSASKPTIEDMQKLLFSFSQWIRIGIMPPQIIQQLHNHSLFQLAISHLSDMQLSQASKQCILNAIQQIKNPDQSPQFYEFMGKNLSTLINTIMKQIKNQQYDQAENFVKVLCEYGKHAGKNIIENFNQNSLSFIEKMINFTEDPMLQVFKDLCDFWQDIIFFMQSRHDKTKLTKVIADQIIVKLYQTFCEKIMYNPSQISELNQLTQSQLAKLHQSVEDVREKRQTARFMFESIGNYLKHQNFINEVIKLIFALDKNQANFWSKIQAYVYSIRDVSKKYVQPTPQICSLVLFFEELKDKPIILLKSILRVYQSLLGMQQKNEQFILRILNNVSIIFQKQILDQKSGKVFQKCCQKNAQILVKYLGSIYQLLKMYPNKESILVGITHILKKNPSILSQNLPLILQKPLQQLKTTKSKKQQRNIFAKLLTIIQCIPKGDSKDLIQIIQMLFQQMWPIIQHIISDPQDPYNGQDRLIERAIKFIKLVMRSIPQQFVKYLNTVFTSIIQCYKKFPINSFVYIYEVAFTVYYQSTQSELISFLKALYNEYCTITYHYLTKPSQIANFEHLVDDFVGLNKRIITFDIRMFFQSGQVQPILKFSIHCLGSGVPRAASTASQLFQIIFMIYWSPYCRQQYQNKDKGEVIRYDKKNETLYLQLKSFLLPMVPDLLRQMFKFLEIGPVQSARDNILDCFQAIALAFPNQSRMIWNQPLDELAQDILTITQKQRFKQNLQKIGSNDHTQFLNAEYTIGKLMYTVGSRYLYRKSRAKSLSNNL